MNKRKNGFTLIELIAVLVILAIIALIVTPLVMNIVKKAKDSSNKRSVDAYGKAVELAVATHLLDYGEYPTTLDNLTVEYTGNEVVCNIQNLNEDGSIYLSECSVNGTEVKDSSTEDGYYHYGKKTVITYDTYKIGDIITYNEMNFYVIADSDENTDYVTLLKAEPLTVDEINTYGAGHVNMHILPTATYYQTASDINGYGGMAYYASETCGYDGSSWVDDGCTTDYDQSEIKYVVDAWSIDKLKEENLQTDDLGYKVRLISWDDLTNNLGYEKLTSGTIYISTGGITPSWVYNSNYFYWTMSAYDDSNSAVWVVNRNGSLDFNGDGNVGSSYLGVVRPVINLKKSAI